MAPANGFRLSSHTALRLRGGLLCGGYGELGVGGQALIGGGDGCGEGGVVFDFGGVHGAVEVVAADGGSEAGIGAAQLDEGSGLGEGGEQDGVGEVDFLGDFGGVEVGGIRLRTRIILP